jgi:hypothetical protein
MALSDFICGHNVFVFSGIKWIKWVKTVKTTPLLVVLASPLFHRGDTGERLLTQRHEGTKIVNFSGFKRIGIFSCPLMAILELTQVLYVYNQIKL